MMTSTLALLLALQAWDTGKPSPAPLAPADLAGKSGWTAVPRDQTLAAFKGDAVVTNGRVLAVFRKQDAAVEIYALRGTDFLPRARVTLHGDGADPAARLERASLTENARAGSAVEAAFKTAKGKTVSARFRLKRGEVSVEIEPAAGAARMRLEAPGRFLVLPDFWTDDIVIDAAKVPGAAADLPSENFVLHMTGNGDAVVMGTFEQRDQDVRATLGGEGEKRAVVASEIQLGGKKAWVSVIEGPQAWHVRDVQAGDAGKILPLEWSMPFPAQWRCDFARTDQLCQSWEMLLQEKEGAGYLKPTWAGSGFEPVGADRKRWTGSLMYTISYPCWTDPQGKGHLQPLKNRWVTYSGPALIYPINRIAKTPAEVFTVVDVARSALGAGPCEYILDVEGQKSERKGRATCSVRDELLGIYKKGDQKKERAEVERYLQQGVDFVKHIRGRIEGYLELARGLREYLASQKKAHPELAESIAPLEKILREIDSHLEDRKEKIKTPEEVVRMTEEFRRTLLDYTGADAADKVKVYTDVLTDIGGNQDDLVARCRWVVKTLRQRAAIGVVQNPALAPVAEEIRARTQKALRGPAIHEEARQ